MSDGMNDDAADLSAARDGGPGGQAAFARLYDRHGPVVLALCRGNLPGRTGAEADDAVQETFIRAWRKLDQLEDPSKLRPWLYGIARLVCAERRRAAGRRTRHEEAAAMNHEQQRAARSDGAAALDGAPQPRAERAEALERLSEALDRLGERERLAIHLYYLDADPVAAAQSALGVSRSAFYKLLSSARTQLAGLLAEVSPS